MFLRLAPVAPNLFLNMAAGIVGVPYTIFILASLIGQLPFTFMYVKAGMMLDQMTTVGGGLDLQTVFWLFVLALIALLPTYLTKKEDKIDELPVENETELKEQEY